MKMRLMLAGGLLLALTGCTTYDYVGGGRSGSYYHGAPSVEYRYPAGYPYNYGPYYGGYGGYYGGYGNPYYSRPIYRPPHNHRPPPRRAMVASTVRRRRRDRRTTVVRRGGTWTRCAARRSRTHSRRRPGPSGTGTECAEDERFPWRNMDRATQRTVER